MEPGAVADRSVKAAISPNTRYGMDLDRTLRSLSSQDFLSLGLSQVAYIRPLEQDGHSYYAIYAADGTQMAILANYGAAIAVVRQHDMEPLTLH